MVERMIEATNGNGEQCKKKIYDGEKILISSVVGGCEVTIKDKNSSKEFRLEDLKSIGELRFALIEICSDKAIK